MSTKAINGREAKRIQLDLRPATLKVASSWQPQVRRCRSARHRGQARRSSINTMRQGEAYTMKPETGRFGGVGAWLRRQPMGLGEAEGMVGLGDA